MCRHPGELSVHAVATPGVLPDSLCPRHPAVLTVPDSGPPTDAAQEASRSVKCSKTFIVIFTEVRVLMSQLCGWLEGTRFTNFVIQHFRLVHVCTRYLKVELSELPLGSYIYPSLFRSVIINFNLTIYASPSIKL